MGRKQDTEKQSAFALWQAGAWDAGTEISFGFQADGIAGELPSNKKFNGVLIA